MGKGAFASRAARFLVTHGRGGDGQPVPLDDPGDAAAGRLVAAGNHPEILTIERLPKDKGKELARNNNIDQVRGMIRRLPLLPSQLEARWGGREACRTLTFLCGPKDEKKQKRCTH